MGEIDLNSHGSPRFAQSQRAFTDLCFSNRVVVVLCLLNPAEVAGLDFTVRLVPNCSMQRDVEVGVRDPLATVFTSTLVRLFPIT